MMGRADAGQADAGATLATPDLQVETVAHRRIRARLSVVQNRLSAVRTAGLCSAESIHTLRVACRRALASVSLFRDLIPDAPRRWFRCRLRGVLETAARVRDLDLLLDHLAHDGPRRDGETLAPLLADTVTRQREVAERAVLRIADGIARGRWSIQLRRLGPGRQSRGDRSVAPRQVRRQLERRVAAFNRHARRRVSGAGALHRLRISGKKLRYALESLPGLIPAGAADRCVASLRTIQGILGEVTDRTTAVTTIRQLRGMCGGQGAPDWDRFHREERLRAFQTRRMFTRWWTRDRRHALRRLCRLMLRKAIE